MLSLGSVFSVFFLLLILTPAFGQDNAVDDSALTISGLVEFNTGEVMTGAYKAVPTSINTRALTPWTIDHAWFGEPLARLNLAFRPDGKMKVEIGFEGNILINTYPPFLKPPDYMFLHPQYMDWRIHQAQGIFSVWNTETVSFELALGYMPYKYNRDVRNLGEFMFRSGTYPFFLINNFNFPLARIAGLRGTLNYKTESMGLTVDQFVITERNIPPMNDISLATIATFNMMKMVDLGAGVNFAHLIPFDSRLTTPEFQMKDGAPNNGIRFEKAPGDTGSYTFKAVKLMARATIDPAGMFRGADGSFISDLMGPEGGKIYGEWGICGLENYPVSFPNSRGDDNPWGYTKISERMPWMVGIKLPFWKLLDVCALELEKYPAPYPNDYYQVYVGSGLPVPTWRAMYDTTAYDSASYSIKRWYWSIYMKKEIAHHISLFSQIAHDHMRWDINMGGMQNYSTEEILVKPGQYAWRMGMSFGF